MAHLPIHTSSLEWKLIGSCVLKGRAHSILCMLELIVISRGIKFLALLRFRSKQNRQTLDQGMLPECGLSEHFLVCFRKLTISKNSTGNTSEPLPSNVRSTAHSIWIAMFDGNLFGTFSSKDLVFLSRSGRLERKDIYCNRQNKQLFADVALLVLQIGMYKMHCSLFHLFLPFEPNYLNCFHRTHCTLATNISFRISVVYFFC